MQIRAEDGELCGRYQILDDFVHLSHANGVFLLDNLLCVLAVSFWQQSMGSSVINSACRTKWISMRTSRPEYQQQMIAEQVIAAWDIKSMLVLSISQHRVGNQQEGSALKHAWAQVRSQTVHILHITDSGKLVVSQKLGAFCRDDDELAISRCREAEQTLHSQAEVCHMRS